MGLPPVFSGLDFQIGYVRKKISRLDEKIVLYQRERVTLLEKLHYLEGKKHKGNGGGQ